MRAMAPAVLRSGIGSNLPPPPNDDFLNAEQITGASGSVSGRNSVATKGAANRTMLAIMVAYPSGIDGLRRAPQKSRSIHLIAVSILC
ncbi:MAG TPA: hypothetical protein VLB68_21340 [Pyrinomonadaceae bacterium]|nr:hypothetical protein [Pyrinomonadaceae bacterium]